MTDRTPKKIVRLFRDMADLTSPECAGVCRVPHSCCSPEYCDMAVERAAEDGITLEETGHPTLRFMGPDGCTVAPHLRPLCTLHVCSIADAGIKRGDPAWTDKYFRLRERIAESSFIPNHP